MKINEIIKNILEFIILSSKWLLIPFYLKLFWTLIKLMYHFIYQGEISNEDIISTLEDIDIVMIANLVKMIIVGSYNSFVYKLNNLESEHITSGGLKIKMATSIIGVSSIYLLQTFINVTNISQDIIIKQILIFGAFIIGALVLAIINYLYSKH